MLLLESGVVIWGKNFTSRVTVPRLSAKISEADVGADVFVIIVRMLLLGVAMLAVHAYASSK